MSTNEIIAIVFRYINFGVFIGLGVYLFKKKLLPIIIQERAKKRAVVQNLASENKDLLVRQRTVEQEISEQEIESKHLYDQIKIWSLVFNKRLSESKNEQQLLMDSSLQRSKVRSDYAAYKLIRNTVCNKALNDSRQNLQGHFLSEEQGRRFMASLVHFVRKEQK